MKIIMESAIFALKKIHFTYTGIPKIYFRKMKIRNDLSQNKQHTENKKYKKERTRTAINQ